MKYSYQKIKDSLPGLDWNIEELAAKLSQIGHETEVDGDQLDVTLTSNRKDCQQFEYLIFDLAAIFELQTNVELPKFDHGDEIPVTIDQINKLLGSNLPAEDLIKLKKLGFVVEAAAVKPPSFRTGITTVADVAEEMLRLVGFSAITIQDLSTQAKKDSPDYQQLQKIKSALVTIGLFETQTYSFDEVGEIELKNPFNEQTPYLRTSLLKGLLDTAAKNPFMKRAMCFEIGDIFTPDEELVLGILLTGQKNYDEVISKLNEILTTQLSFNAADDKLIERCNVKQPNPVWAQIKIAELPMQTSEINAHEIPQFKPISKYPPLVRDITVSMSLESAQSKIKEASSKFEQLLMAEIIDTFTKPGETIPAVTIRFIFQKYEASFTEAEIQSISDELSGFLN